MLYCEKGHAHSRTDYVALCENEKEEAMVICDVYSCRGSITTLMKWSNRRLRLCDEHTGFYRSIAGNHVHFEPIASQDESEVPNHVREDLRKYYLGEKEKGMT